MKNTGIRKKIGMLVRSLRESQGLLQEDLAENARLPERTILAVENGIVNPSRIDFLRVINTLKISSSEREVIGRLLSRLFPRGKRKFHLHSSVLQQRSRRRGYRGRR